MFTSIKVVIKYDINQRTGSLRINEMWLIIKVNLIIVVSQLKIIYFSMNVHVFNLLRFIYVYR